MSGFGPPTHLTDGIETAHPDALADLLRLVRTTRKEWQDTEAAIESLLATKAGVGQHSTDGGTYIVRQAATKVEWDHDTVRRNILSRARDERILDETTGEYEGEGEAVARIIWTCVPASPSWRVGGLKALGLDPSELRTKIPGRKTVEII